MTNRIIKKTRFGRLTLPVCALAGALSTVSFPQRAMAQARMNGKVCVDLSASTATGVRINLGSTVRANVDNLRRNVTAFMRKAKQADTPQLNSLLSELEDLAKHLPNNIKLSDDGALRLSLTPTQQKLLDFSFTNSYQYIQDELRFNALMGTKLDVFTEQTVHSWWASAGMDVNKWGVNIPVVRAGAKGALVFDHPVTGGPLYYLGPGTKMQGDGEVTFKTIKGAEKFLRVWYMMDGHRVAGYIKSSHAN